MDLRILFSFCVFILGLLLILIVFTRNRQPTARFLTLPLLTLTCTNFLFYLFDSKLMLSAPFLFRIGPLINFLTAPAIFLYVLHEIRGKNVLKPMDALHLLPFTLFLIDYFPLFTSSNAYKEQILLAIYQNKNAALLFREGWLIPPGFHDILRHAISIVYIIFMTDMIVRHNDEKAGMNHQPAKQITWIQILLSLFFIMSAAGILNYFIIDPSYLWIATVWQQIIISFMLYCFLLFNPDIMYGSYMIAITDSNDKKKPVILPEDITNQVRINLKKYVAAQNYTQKNIRIKDVAESLGVQPYILSAYIHQSYEMHFNDFINLNRIHFIKDKIRSKHWNSYTLEAIAEEAGFTNRTTFLSAFKKFTGMTPTFYMHYFKNEELDK